MSAENVSTGRRIERPKLTAVPLQNGLGVALSPDKTIVEGHGQIAVPFADQS
jgi:hypothetical protein